MTPADPDSAGQPWFGTKGERAKPERDALRAAEPDPLQDIKKAMDRWPQWEAEYRELLARIDPEEFRRETEGTWVAKEDVRARRTEARRMLPGAAGPGFDPEFDR